MKKHEKKLISDLSNIVVYMKCSDGSYIFAGDASSFSFVKGTSRHCPILKINLTKDYQERIKK